MMHNVMKGLFGHRYWYIIIEIGIYVVVLLLLSHFILIVQTCNMQIIIYEGLPRIIFVESLSLVIIYDVIFNYLSSRFP